MYRKWTKDKCAVEAKKFKTRLEFQKKSHGSYRAALRYGWLDEVCSHMKHKMVWTKKKCAEIAKKYKRRVDFSKQNSVAYQFARKSGWLDDICSHMERQNNKELCAKKAKKYKSRTEFYRKDVAAYRYATTHGFLDEICGHMTERRGKHKQRKWKRKHSFKFYHNKENCRVAASKCSSRTEFCNTYHAAYMHSLKNNWMDEICSHMLVKSRNQS